MTSNIYIAIIGLKIQFSNEGTLRIEIPKRTANLDLNFNFPQEIPEEISSVALLTPAFVIYYIYFLSSILFKFCKQNALKVIS
jgi:hypothetical protein